MVLKPKLEQMVGLIIAPCLFSVPPPPCSSHSSSVAGSPGIAFS